MCISKNIYCQWKYFCLKMLFRRDNHYFQKKSNAFALQATPVKSAHLHTFRRYYPLKKLLELFYSPCCFWILNGNIFIIRNDSFEWISTVINGGLQKAPILCNLKASRISIELQNYWRSVEMRTDTLKKESHIAFRHPISSSTPYSETERSGKL